MILIITLCVSYVNANKLVFNEYSIKQLAFDEGFINKVLEMLTGIGDNTTDNMDAVNETMTDGNLTMTTDDDIIDDIKPVEDDVPLRETATESTESVERHDGFIVPEFENVGQKRFRTVGHQPMETKFTAGTNVAKEGTKDPVKLVTGFIADLFKVKPDTS